MNRTPTAPIDPAALAAEVRHLAHAVRGVLNDPGAPPPSARALAWRADRLRARFAAGPHNPLAAYLENLAGQAGRRAACGR